MKKFFSKLAERFKMWVLRGIDINGIRGDIYEKMQSKDYDVVLVDNEVISISERSK